MTSFLLTFWNEHEHLSVMKIMEENMYENESLKFLFRRQDPGSQEISIYSIRKLN